MNAVMGSRFPPGRLLVVRVRRLHIAMAHAFTRVEQKT
jgi:hypothetical protein